MRLALDTNILAYAEGVNGEQMKQAALQLIEKLPLSATLLPIQALGELFSLLVRKAGRRPQKARASINAWRDVFAVIETSDSVLLAATDLAVDHRLNIWDAVIVSAAAESGCRLVLSEDLQDGFNWKGLTIVDPFRDSMHPLLQSVLEGSS